MKKILLGAWASIFFGCLTTSVQATNPVWNNSTGDDMWNTTANWAANPANQTDIFNNTSVGATAGRLNVYFNADFTAARFRQNVGAPVRVVSIAPAFATSNAMVKFTISGAAESIDAGAATADFTLDGTPLTNGARLVLQLNSTAPISVNAGASINLNLDVMGAGGVNKTSAGTLFLGGSNTYSGQTIVSAGTLRIGHLQALSGLGLNLGTNVPAVAVSAGGTLDLGGLAGVNKVLVLNGGGATGAGGALINSSNTVASLVGDQLTSISVTGGGASFSYPTTVSITGGGGSGAAATASLGLTSASISISNPGINYTAPPTVGFSGGGGTGATAISQIDTNAGTVTNIVVTNPGRNFTNAPTVTLTLGGGTDAAATAVADQFQVVGTTLTAAGSGYTSQPTIDFTDGVNGGGATATANFGSVVLATDSAIGGNGPITINSIVSGAAILTKNGAGILTLTAANTYSGGTIINAGTLLANNTSGSGTGPGAVTVNGGTLGGTGTVSGAVTVNSGGSVGGGASAGKLTLANGLNLSGGGTNVWELATPKDDSNGVGGTDFDQIALTGGTLDLSGNSRLLVKFLGDTAPFSTNTFWQANHTWTIVALTGGASNSGNLPFAAIPNGIFNAGTFSNYVGTGGKIMLTFTTNAPSKPVITSEPQNTTTNWGKPASFSVTAFGTDPESYQWYFQNVSGPIGGATASSYSIASVDPTNQGNYFVIITNVYGSATSVIAALTVVVTPSPTMQPLVGGGTTNVTVSWNSVVGGAYQLYYNTNLGYDTNLGTTNWYLLSNLVANGTSVTVLDHPPAGQFQRYYRIIAQ